MQPDVCCRRRPSSTPAQMGHATAEAVLRAGLTLVPYTFTGQSEAVAVGNVGVSGVPVELVAPEERIKCLEVGGPHISCGCWPCVQRAAGDM